MGHAVQQLNGLMGLDQGYHAGWWTCQSQQTWLQNTSAVSTGHHGNTCHSPSCQDPLRTVQWQPSLIPQLIPTTHQWMLNNCVADSLDDVTLFGPELNTEAGHCVTWMLLHAASCCRICLFASEWQNESSDYANMCKICTFLFLQVVHIQRWGGKWKHHFKSLYLMNYL